MGRLVARGPIILAVGIGLVLGAIAGAVYGRSSDTANWITAASTVALTIFAFIQLLRIEADAEDKRNERRHQFEAIATLARRSCIAAVEVEGYYTSRNEWAVAVSRGLPSLQAQFLELRSLGASLGAIEGAAAKEAFDAFITAADRLNVLADSRRSL